MIYVLLEREQDDYSKLLTSGEAVCFLFKRVNSVPTQQEYTAAKNTLLSALDKADPRDRVLFNGPGWLVALAGYIWYANGDRSKAQQLFFNRTDKSYTCPDLEIGDL